MVQDRIRVLRSRGWTMAAIAEELGVTSGALWHWTAGRRAPTNPKGLVALLDQMLGAEAPA